MYPVTRFLCGDLDGMTIEQENKCLRGIVSHLWKTYKYQQEYISHLSGGTTEEEFQLVAEKYATPFREHIDRHNLIDTLSLIDNTVQASLDEMDYATLLNMHSNTIAGILNS